MKKQKNQISQIILSFLSEVFDLLPAPFETPYAYVRRTSRINRNQYLHSLRRMKNSGYIQIAQKNHQKFVNITKKGELKMLFNKIRLSRIPAAWDKKWRLIMFDIPERSRDKRNHLRILLKNRHFTKLQQSVFVSPYPLNREAIKYLEKTGLRQYIRVLRVDEMDNEKELRQQYKLKKT